MQRILAAAALCAAATLASAQIATPDPDWRELDAPAPPPVRTQGLIPLDMHASTLRFGVDPASVSVGTDGIVRYVVVASSASGTVNAMYEGIRCNTAEVKTYARHNPDSGWVPTRSVEWRKLHDVPNTRHSLLVARTGACVGHGPNGNAAQVVRDLKSGPDTRFRPEVR
jgi:hypothetical protein